ncbi:MAG: septum formation initiator family protein [Candidatus Latescibacteria bacterium]|nr:septum formation initiator family protein [Candidatus Latescibacterota bacterium]
MDEPHSSSRGFPKQKKIIWIFLALLLFVVYLLVTNENGIFRIRQLRGRVKTLETEIGILERKKTGLEREKDLLLNDLDYIEKKAREEYGMLKEGEKIYKVRFIETEESEEN